jgi:flagellar motor switch protein FliG
MSATEAVATLELEKPAPVLQMKGVQKAAAIMLTLTEEDAARVLEHLDEDEIRMVSTAMADIGNISAADMGAIVADFDRAVASYSSVAGSLAKTESILGKALPPDQVKAIMDELRKPSRGVWKKLSTVDRGLLSAYLRGEHPQTIALVLTNIESEITSRILGSFPQPLAISVINRMLKLQPVQKEVLEQLEQNLESDLLANFSVKKKTDTHAAMADIFNSFDRQTETRLMEALEQVNQLSSRRIRELMFTFEDLMKLDAASIQTVIRASDKNVLAKSLQGASDMVMNVFLSNMSSRSAKVLADDIASLNNLPRTEIEASQGELIKLAKLLIERGEITNPKAKADGDSLDYDLS